MEHVSGGGNNFKLMSKIHANLVFSRALGGPVRVTPPYRAIPFRDRIAEGAIAPICVVFIGYRASIAEIPLLRGGIAPPLRMLSKGETEKTTKNARFVFFFVLPGKFKTQDASVLGTVRFTFYGLQSPRPATEPRIPETLEVHFKVGKMSFVTPPRKNGPKSQIKYPKKSVWGNQNVQRRTLWTF